MRRPWWWPGEDDQNSSWGYPETKIDPTTPVVTELEVVLEPWTHHGVTSMRAVYRRKP